MAVSQPALHAVRPNHRECHSDISPPRRHHYDFYCPLNFIKRIKLDCTFLPQCLSVFVEEHVASYRNIDFRLSAASGNCCHFCYFCAWLPVPLFCWPASSLQDPCHQAWIQSRRRHLAPWACISWKYSPYLQRRPESKIRYLSPFGSVVKTRGRLLNYHLR
jgi:hypothetical protein